MSFRTITVKNRTVLVLDFRGHKEPEMIEIVMEAKNQVLKLDKPVLILSVYDDRTFITPKFMRIVEGQSLELLHLIEKQAVVGLTPVKKLILKGYNFLLKRNIQNFDTEQDALEFLLNPTTTDNDLNKY